MKKIFSLSTATFLAGLVAITATGCDKAPSEEPAKQPVSVAPAAPVEAAVTAAYSSPGLCLADSSWVSNPSLPSPFEVPNGSGADLCNFDQLSWQIFLDITDNSSGSPEFLSWMPSNGVFENKEIKASPTAYGTNPAITDGPCSGQSPAFYSNLNEQAGSDYPLIDQNGNYTFYQVTMNEIMYDFAVGCGLTTVDGYKTLCTKPLSGQTSIPTSYPAGAMILKTAWKIIEPDEAQADDYYSVANATIVQPPQGVIVNPPGESTCKNDVTLGLSAMHIAAATDLHPEMVWASFSFDNNTPNCADLTDAQNPPLGGDWKFFNSNCSGVYCENNTYYPPIDYALSQKLEIDMNVPAQACTLYANGGGIPTNVSNIISLNTSVQSFIPDGSIWKNYNMLGGIWTNGGTPPNPSSNQRGSLQLSNSIMETFTQPPTAPHDNFAANCFTCHSYSSTDSPTEVSHLPRTTNP